VKISPLQLGNDSGNTWGMILEIDIPEVRPCRIGDQEYPTMHCAHPGILMRKGDGKNPWPERHSQQFIPALKKAL